MKSNGRAPVLGGALAALAVTLVGCGQDRGTAAVDGSAALCDRDIRVLAQPRDSLVQMEVDREQFRQIAGVDFSIDYLNENDRRAKSRLDASTTGTYHVYYVDEANVSLFAENGWIVPLDEHYPEAYDFADFDAARVQAASYKGVPYFAPIQGGSDLMYFRKDLLERAGIRPPETLDELLSAAQALHDPQAGIYGIALRGGRGSGANVWRWGPYFSAYGGQLADAESPRFESEAGLKATETYLSLFKYSPPNTRTGSWTEATEAFNSGQVALIIESAPLAAMTEDPRQSRIAGKVGYAAPPAPLPGAVYAHGLAIGAKANRDDRARACAATFIAWATSKEQEAKRLAAGNFGELNRTSILTGEAFRQKYPPALVGALSDARGTSQITYWNRPQWLEVGDRWGILLEQLIVGTRTDVRASLAELDRFVEEVEQRSASRR